MYYYVVLANALTAAVSSAVTPADWWDHHQLLSLVLAEDGVRSTGRHISVN